MEIIRKVSRIFAMVSLGSLIILLLFYTMFMTVIDFPLPADIQSLDNISEQLPSKDQIAIKRSRMSTVQVLSASPSGRRTKLTGTYIVARKKFYILTALHGIIGACEDTWVWSKNRGYTDCKEIVFVDYENDYAIIEIEKLPELAPVVIPGMLPPAREWKNVLGAQTKIYYTGFPNGSGLLTFDGRITGYSNNELVYINSHAWTGSSGSGVFNRDGKLIGFIVALNVGQTEYGTAVLAGMMYVVPTFKVDWSVIL
jgi:S1-C subfamily serine protease